MNFSRTIVFLSALLFAWSSGIAGAVVTISPTDSNILYTGRFDTSNSSAPVFGWSGTSITANFEGTSLKARFDGYQWGDDYLWVSIDDGNPLRLNLNTNATTYTLATGLTDTVHKVQIVKESEGWDGDIVFNNFQIDDGKSLVAPPSRPPVKLEFYGDSGTAGASGLSECDCGGGLNRTSYYNYSGITSRMLNAEYSNISRSGITISRNGNRITDIWDKKTYYKNGPKWNFNNYTPDAVVISLGANDIFTQSEQQIRNGWKGFVTNEIRPVYPDAHVVFANFYGYSAIEPGNYLADVVQELHDDGDTNISFVKMPWLFSTGGHAVVSENAGYANILAPHIADRLGLPTPIPSLLSSIAPRGEVGNGSLEASFTAGEVDGWRVLAGNPMYMEGTGDAHSGMDYVRVDGGEGFFHSTDASEGDEFSLSAWMRGDAGNDGNLKIEFRGQGQNLLESIDSFYAVNGSWQEFTTSAIAPAGTWQIRVVLTASGGNSVEFDDIDLSLLPLGDFDFDKDIDGADFLQWQLGESPYPFSASDLADWAANYGGGLAFTAASTAVPEPSGFALIAVGLLGMSYHRRKQA